MQPVIGNIDGSCFYLFLHYEELEESIKRELDQLTAKITESISSENLQAEIKSAQSQLFRLRLLAAKWMIEESIFDLLDESYPFFEELAKDKKLGILGENILFAIRSNHKVARQFFSVADGGISEEAFKEAVPLISGVTLDQLVSLFKINIPGTMADRVIEWVEVSLEMEYLILAGALIRDREIEVSSNTVDKLAFLVADSAQTYTALAIEIGILKLPTHSPLEDVPSGTLDKEFLDAQRRIADSGISSFAKNWNE